MDYNDVQASFCKCRVVLKPNSEHLVKEKVLEIDCVVGKTSSSTIEGATDSKSTNENFRGYMPLTKLVVPIPLLTTTSCLF